MKKTLLRILGSALIFALLVTPSLGPARRAGDAVAAQAARSAPQHLPTGTTGAGEAGQLDWVLRSPASPPSARYGAAMAYDSARGVTVLFGGQSSSGYLNDTWEWDGTTWAQRTPANVPPARYIHALAYDGARGVSVLFGGGDGYGHLDDTWEWDGTDWTQRNAADHPSARGHTPMAYDSARGVTVLFGGDYGGSNYLDDTWEWDGMDWVQRVPASTPGLRSYHAMAYDANRGVTVLLGGFFESAVTNDTWEYGLRWSLYLPMALRAYPMGGP